MDKKIVALIGTVIVFVVLFLARITGVYVHVVVASIFLIVLLLHAFKKAKQGTLVLKSWQRVNRTLFGLVGILIVSGILMGIPSIHLYALIVHKLSSILFLVCILLHCKQHILYLKINKGKKASQFVE